MKRFSKVISITLVIALLVAILPSPVAVAFPDTAETQYSGPAINDQGGQMQSVASTLTTQQATIDSQQTGEESYQTSEIVGEETDMRTETGTCFRNADGTSVAVDYGYPVHYKRFTNGPWEPMDYSLVDNVLR
ncbi:MAG: hypothetical protein FWF45_05195 [Coriobacteriia bacterium]|nr:hypothetical protein [Coriobacteriia bacterium]